MEPYEQVRAKVIDSTLITEKIFFRYLSLISFMLFILCLCQWCFDAKQDARIKSLEETISILENK